MTQPNPEFEQQTFIVLDPDYNQVGVVYGRDVSEAILKIPPKHGLRLDEDVTKTAESIMQILDLNVQQN